VVEPMGVERGPRGRRSSYRFRHILIQQHVFRHVGEGARSYLHEAVAAAIEAVYGDDADPLALAWHWNAAGVPTRAVPYLRQAGETARRAGAVAEAIERFTAALEHGEELEPLARAGLLRDLGECYHWRADRRAALRVFEEARALFMDHGDVRSAGAVEATIGVVLWEARDVARAVSVTEAAVASLDVGPQTPELAMALCTLAMIQRVYSHDAEALSYAQRALDVATRVGSDAARMRGLVWAGVVLASTDPSRHDEGLAMIEESKRIAERRGAVWWASLAANQLGARLRAMGRFGQAIERLETAIGYAEEHDLPLNANFAFSELWSHRWRSGAWDIALAQRARLQRHVEGEGTLAMLQGSSLIHLAQAYLDLGLPEEAQAVLDHRGRALEMIDEPQVRVPYLRERLRIAMRHGDDEESDGYAFRVIDCLVGRITHSEEVPLPLVTVCRWLARRESRSARQGVETCLAALAQAESQFASDETRAARLEGSAAAAGGLGSSREAAHLFAVAADGWQRCGFPLDEARARCSAALLLDRTGASEEAESQRFRADECLRALQDRLPSGTLFSAFEKERVAMMGGKTA
jgi:tetratricopeptide (TPR) repeat protein